jgi:hypothetical protein
MFAELKKLLHDLKEEGTLLHDLTVCRVCRAFDIEISEDNTSKRFILIV